MNDYRKTAADGVSAGNWFLTLFFSCIPGLNIIVWAFMSASRHNSKRTFARAALLWLVFILLAAVIAYLVLCITNKIDVVNDFLHGFKKNDGSDWIGSFNIPELF
jgi:hypothetical protein